MKFSLSGKIAAMITLIAIALSGALILLSYYHYRGEMLSYVERQAMDIAAVAASQLDPDRIQYYLDTGNTDEAYDTAYDTLCDIRENGGIEYLYVVKPEINEVWYVMDTDPSEGAIPLGYHEPYYEGAFKENSARMARGERIDPLISNEEFGWLMSVYYPMFTTDGNPAGYVGVDILMTDIMDDLHRFAVSMVLLMVGITVVLAAIFIRVVSSTIARPIRSLSRAAARMVREEQTGQTGESAIFKNLTIRSRDEIGVLYRSLRQMEMDMNSYIRDLLSVTAEKERIGAELNVATQIQADLLPSIFPPFPERSEFEIYATMNPAKEVGGDFYDFFFVDNDHLAMVMADVSGKGVPAALFMVIAKTLIKSRGQRGDSPGQILANVNEQLCEGNEAELFVTVWLAVLEISTGKGIAVNAGHEHPVIRRAGGEYELVVYRHSPAVAAMEGIRFREHEFELHPGDCLFVYTDGVPEATNGWNELYGTDRMLRALNRYRDLGPEKLLPKIRQSVAEFVGDAPQFDDITMLGFEFFGGGKTDGRTDD